MTNKELIEITYYTDPLCCWSWGFEPQWLKLKSALGENISYRYKMAGMIQDWNQYNDPLNSISKPSQMGALWMEAAKTTSVQIDNTIWIKNPPASSFPSCVAFKTAELQSLQVAEVYLRYLRESVMIKCVDISKQEILMDIAEKLSKDFPEAFDLEKFKNDFAGEESVSAFKEDLQLIKKYNINRYPTLTISKPGKNGIGITGYRPYNVLIDAIKNFAPEIFKNEKEPFL